MNNKILLVALGIIILGGGLYLLSTKDTNQQLIGGEMEEKEQMEKEALTQTEADQKMLKEEKEMEEDMTMDKEEASTDEMMEGDMSKGSYELYANEKLAMAKQGQVVLFFKASWCPSCRVVDADIKASLSDIPNGVTILEVNYDDSTDLKKKYGVTSQHTFVQVDANGNQLNKWSGGSTLESILGNLK
jgi:thioredoxin 1